MRLTSNKKQITANIRRNSILCFDPNEPYQIKIFHPNVNDAFLTSTMAFTHQCTPWERRHNKTGRDILCTHPITADWHDIIIQPLLMWKHGVTVEKQTERNMGDERLTAGLKEKEERKYRQTKRKCVGEIQTRRWRLLDLLLLEDLAFSESAWSKEGKLGKIIE